MQSFKTMVGVLAALLVAATGAVAQETVSLADPANREVLRGVTTGSQAGFWLDRGDLSAADNRRDLIVGSPGWSSNKGRVYLIFSGPVPGGEVSLSLADVILSGANAGDRFGEATAAGYITANELDPSLPTRDLVVSAPGANSNAGAVYVFLRGFLNAQTYATTDARITIVGAPAGARLGASLATGDLDGDGYREIIAGAPGVGAVYVIHGGPSVTGTIDLSVPSAAFFKIQGSVADGVGQSLAAGDLTGHGLPTPSTGYDVAIGAFNEAGGGAVYVIRGRSSNTFAATMNLPTDADARFGGIDSGDQAGKSLDIAPFDTFDTTSDLIIGAPMAAGPGNARAQAGEIYAIWGSPTLASRSLSLADLTIYGAAAGNMEGTDVATGDVDRRFPYDLVSLAPGANPNGELHLILGRQRSSFGSVYDLATRQPDRRLVGDPAAGPIQSTLILDLTGEGFEDVIAGMPAGAEGLVYVSFSIGPVITTAPTSRTVNPGSLVTFSATASGAPPPTVRWQVSVNNGTFTDIGGATSTNYRFTAQPADSGKRFRAIFTNSNGSATTSAATLTVRSTIHPATRSDLDGDGISDIVVWRPGTGTWHSLRSSNGFNPSSAGTNQWGNQAAGDMPFMGDMDGDGIMDLVVWRPSNGTWYWLTSSSGYDPALAGAKQWGASSQGDVPFLGDMDGDGKADLVIWRASTGTWYWLTSSTGYNYANATAKQWGNLGAGDRPMLGQLDGDGKADLVVWRAPSGTWFWLTSSTGYDYAHSGAKQWGNQSLGDTQLLGDIDGDGLSDLIVWRASSGTWYWLKSSAGYDYAAMSGVQWGSQSLGDVPLVGDFDGDNRAELVVWRASTGTWYWLTSSSGYSYSSAYGVQWGSSSLGDMPILK